MSACVTASRRTVTLTILLIDFALGLDPWRIALKENEQAPLRPGVFERDRQQGFDESVENDLAGYRLRGGDHSPNIHLLNRRADRGGRLRRR